MELTGKRYGRGDWRKLMGTRRGTVTIAVVCALVAAGILIYAMARYRSSVNRGTAPEAVFVANQLIPKNTPGDVISSNGMFRVTHIATRQVSAGAIADAALLRGEVAAHDIYPGEQLTTADFTLNGGLPAQLQPSERAMTLTMDQEHGMLGLIQPGDHVDVYAGISSQSGAGQATPELRLLISNVPVLKPGTSNGNSGIAGAATNNTSGVTLEVPATDAGLLAFAADNGKVWLVLRPANATSTPSAPLITLQSLLLGTKPVPFGGRK
jgi:Flp pilus assembly protein CpaB